MLGNREIASWISLIAGGLCSGAKVLAWLISSRVLVLRRVALERLPP
jgi:hypothetical protein